MLHSLHYVHFVFHLLVEDAVLHELPLIKLLGRVRNAVKLVRDPVNCGEGALTDLTDPMILI